MLDDPNDDVADDESDPDKLWSEIGSLRRRLELRAVENRQLLLALETIGMCASAQGRRFTIAILTVPDDQGGMVMVKSPLLVADSEDREEIAFRIAAALADDLADLRASRSIHPAAESVLEVLADLDIDGALASEYGGLGSHEGCPLDDAIAEWRDAGRPFCSLGHDEDEDDGVDSDNVVLMRPGRGEA